MPLPGFIGHDGIVSSLERMLAEDRLPQTLLFAGPLGVGKATLARYLAAMFNCAQGAANVCGQCRHCARILSADLSQEPFRQQLAEREKMPAMKRGESPLILSAHPDFLIFPPDGPLRMIGIEQARQLRMAARYGPSEGRRRLFHIDHADRANAEAANSLLKTLEEPAPGLTIVLTTENPYELLATIRSRAVPFYFSPLTPTQMEEFLAARPEVASADRARLSSWAQGSPGQALEMEPGAYIARRDAMLALLETAVERAEFSALLAHTESIGRSQAERLHQLCDSLRGLLADLLHLKHGSRQELRNADVRDRLEALLPRVGFDWIESAAEKIEELERLERRNIQKQIALEALALDLRTGSSPTSRG